VSKITWRGVQINSAGLWLVWGIAGKGVYKAKKLYSQKELRGKRLVNLTEREKTRYTRAVLEKGLFLKWAQPLGGVSFADQGEERGGYKKGRGGDMDRTRDSGDPSCCVGTKKTTTTEEGKSIITT